MATYWIMLLLAVVAPFTVFIRSGCESNNFMAIKCYQAALSFLLVLFYLLVGKSFYKTMRAIY